MMFTGVPVSASIDPACAEKASGISICDGDSAGPGRDDDDHRDERGDRPVDADQRGEHRDEQADDDEQPARGRCRRAR